MEHDCETLKKHPDWRPLLEGCNYCPFCGEKLIDPFPVNGKLGLYEVEYNE